MPSVEFRPIDLSAHFRVCVEFICDTFVCSYGSAEGFHQMGGEPAYRGGLKNLLEVFPEGCVHVWRDERIVGQIEMSLRPDLGLVFLNLLYLVPSERGSGIGSDVHAYMVRTCADRGYARMQLSVSPTNHQAVRYYAKHGWRDLGPRPDRAYVHAMMLDVRP
jgi:GNAT superfamily N-acetyltransferase